MADDGLEYSTDMTDFTSKSNRKLILQATGTQLTNLFTTYPGQIQHQAHSPLSAMCKWANAINPADNVWQGRVDEIVPK